MLDSQNQLLIKLILTWNVSHRINISYIQSHDMITVLSYSLWPMLLQWGKNEVVFMTMDFIPYWAMCVRVSIWTSEWVFVQGIYPYLIYLTIHQNECTVVVHFQIWTRANFGIKLECCIVTDNLPFICLLQKRGSHIAWIIIYVCLNSQRCVWLISDTRAK